MTRLYKKSGRKIDGAGTFRDAVRSTRNKVVHATGLNLVILTLRISPPWGGMPIGLPVVARLHRKGGPTTLDLAEQVIVELASWLADRSFSLCADGAYASLAGRGLPRTTLTSRMRRDAALYAAAPPRTGKRGRPRTKGERLPTPVAMAQGLSDAAFAKVTVDFRGRVRDLLVWSRPVLWYSVHKVNLVLLAVVRDPERVMHDDFFFSTDLEANPADVASNYAGRWSIECVRPRGQAVPRRRGPPVLEASRTRTGRLIVAVALRGDLDLVHPDLRDLSDVDPPAVVSEEGHPELPRRARPAPPGPLGRTNYPHVISRATSREILDGLLEVLAMAA